MWFEDECVKSAWNLQIDSICTSHLWGVFKWFLIILRNANIIIIIMKWIISAANESTRIYEMGNNSRTANVTAEEEKKWNN